MSQGKIPTQITSFRSKVRPRAGRRFGGDRLPTPARRRRRFAWAGGAPPRERERGELSAAASLILAGGTPLLLEKLLSTAAPTASTAVEDSDGARPCSCLGPTGESGRSSGSSLYVLSSSSAEPGRWSLEVCFPVVMSIAV
jgi:hypothetical protein